MTELSPRGPVTVGQPLAELDTDKLQATVASSRAKLDATRAKVTEAEATVVEKARDYDRKKALAERQVTSVHERAVASLASAKADVGVADAWGGGAGRCPRRSRRAPHRHDGCVHCRHRGGSRARAGHAQRGRLRCRGQNRL